MTRNLIERDQAQLIIVDMQEKMLPHIAQQETVAAQAARMIQGAGVLELPLTVTEQYVKGLGPTVRDIASVTEEVRDRAQLEKMTFSAFRDEAMRERIASLQRPFALIAGVETHVCVQQTAIDLINAHMQPVILADAVGSRRPADRDVALDRMRAAGAIVTTVEAAIFEMLDRAGTDLFKRMLPLVK